MLGDHLGASRDLTLETVSRIEVAMQRLEANMNQDPKMGRVRDRQGCTPIPTCPYGKSLYKTYMVDIYGL